MGYCIRKKRKKYKNSSYLYFELVKTYRDPKDKTKVKSKFLCHLGKDKKSIKEKLERFKAETSGQYSSERLLREIEQEMKKHNSDPDFS